MTPETQTIALLEARLEELQGHFETMAILLDHSTDAVERRDDTIAALRAEVDQRKAAEDEATRNHRQAWAEVERLRFICRRAGVEWRPSLMGGAS